ncbi:MAG: carboxylesterase family protein [Lachnospiraceae bacterium]|nr:carboxylesterase family protein [Lachnospiraceae bacterium]
MYPKRLIHQAISNPDFPVVETKYGKLRGTWTDDCFIFRGIEYAKARRFHLPEEPDCWEGVKAAVAYGPVPDEISTRIPGDAFTEPHYWYPQSEFCQNLNVWTPSIDRDRKLPVMVWIHGGGQEHGSAIEISAYDGEELAKWGNVVVVSVNHRLNVLGYLDLSSYGEEYQDSGYVGMMDLVQSLKWVRENIRSFGGDPENVMLFGQSGGGFKILELMQMPTADGLYHKVSIHSGTGKDTCFTHENAAPVARDIAEYLGLTKESIREIETIPYYQLAKATNYAYDRFIERTGARLQWTPPVDNEKFFGNPQIEGVQFREETKQIPMLAGSVLGEFTSSCHHNDQIGDIDTWSQETVEALLKERYGVYADDILEQFRKAYPDKGAANALYVDVFMRKPHRNLCRMRADQGCGPTWNWIFAMDMPCYGGSTPWHNADEAYIFHHAEYFESEYIPGVSERVQDEMAGTLVAFAYTNNPNHTGLPQWETVTKDRFPTMVFDRKSEVRYNHDEKLIDLVEKAGALGPGGKGPVRTYGGGPRAHV